MRRMYVTCLLAYTFAMVIPCHSQQHGGPFSRIDLGPGAAHPWVSALAQDQQGFIWIGTQFGLYRHDGVHIKRYHELGDSPLKSNVVTALSIDTSGRLWIGTSHGLSVLYLGLDSLVRDIAHDQSASRPSISNGYISQLHCDRNGNIWIGMRNNTLCRVAPDFDIDYTRFEFGTAESAGWDCYEISAFNQDMHGNIWARCSCDDADRVGFLRVNDIDASVQYEGVLEIPNNYEKLVVLNNDLLLLSPHSIQKYQPVSGIFHPVFEDWWPSDRQFDPMCVISSGNDRFIMGMWTGDIIRTDLRQTEAVTHVIGRPLQTYIMTLLVDVSNTLWIGTNDGVFTSSNQSRDFTRMLKIPGAEDPSDMNRMRGMLEHEDGQIYMGSYAGMFLYDEATGEASRATELTVPRPYSMARGDDQSFWVGTDGGGLFKYFPEAGTYQSIIKNTSDKRFITSNSILELYHSPDSLLWLGTSNGLSYYDPGVDSFFIATDVSGKPLLSEFKIFDIKSDGDDTYWLASSQGLVRLTVDDKRKFEVQTIDEVPFKLRELLLAPDNKLWIASEGNGLIRYNTLTGNTRFFTQPDGLSNNIIYSMIHGPSGELWLGTFEGLSRFDTATNQFRNFYTSDGLPHNEFNTLSQLSSSRGIIYMGTQNGVVSFEPLQFEWDSTDIPIMLHSVSEYNLRTDSMTSRTVFTDEIEPVILSHRGESITFEYALADYHNPENNRYSYILEGLNNQWQYHGNQTTLTFSSLPAGDFLLRIKAAGSDGRWSRHELQVPIKSQAPFHATPWFTLTVIVVLSALGFLVHRLRIEQLKRMQKLRMDIAGDLHDELGTTLTSIGIQSALIKAEAESNSEHSRLKDISQLSQEAVSMLSDIVWSIHSEHDEFGDLVDRIQELVHFLFSSSDIECRVQVVNGDRDRLLKQVVKQNSYLICKEAIHNIVKHSNATSVDVFVQCEGTALHLTVADNGTGDSKNNGMGGNGIRNMHTRADKMSAQLSIDQDDGFTVSLTVPQAFS